jgi:hypothetical protein
MEIAGMRVFLLPLLLIPGAGKDDVAVRIDDFATKHWQSAGVKPAELAPDAVFLRRVTLDLAGRIPTVQEAKSFLADPAADKRARAIRRLLESPEYAMHMGRVLDEIVQDRYSGDGEFLEYLRASVAKHKPWDQVFREVLLGPWDQPEIKPANQFLFRRIKSLEDLTTDTSRVFFGVNVSCAQCHDHPLVRDWKQDHYYGMASFFNRTSAKGIGKFGQGVDEKTSGEVMFSTRKGEKRTAKMMFLSSKIIEEPAKKDLNAPFSRREQLVKAALEERNFFSKAIVNQLWANFLGRGLVHPVDQMHSANLPAIPGLLEWLGEDLASHGYNLDRLVAGIVSSRIYQLDSTRSKGGERDFAQASLRALTPQQYAVSLILATGDNNLDAAKDAKSCEAAARNLERAASSLVKSKLLDPRGDRHQASTSEALFMSNHPEVQKLIEPTKTNLTGRLLALTDTKEVIDTAIWTLLSRAPEAEERDYLVKWLESKPDRARACRQLVWSLMTSAEFRFNH